MLNIGNTSGDFKDWVKYNAKAGRWYVKGEAGDVEVQNPVFVANFADIQTGWFYYSAGAAPERVMDVSLTEAAPKPDRTYEDQNGKTRDCFKRGFSLDLFSEKSFGGIVELSSTSAAMSGPINDLYTLYEGSKESKEGKLPVVAFVRADAVTGKHGTNYSPVFEIQKWVDRPDAFNDDVAPVAAAETPTPPPPTATPVASSGVSEF